jgi:hypothetical protein
MNHLDITDGDIGEHQEAVEQHHRFEPRLVDGVMWDFKHLDAFALKVPVELSPTVVVTLDVIVLFTNHCFTRGIATNEKLSDEFLWDDGREVRALDPSRYELSTLHLRRIVQELPKRPVLIADSQRPNYVTFEVQPSNPDDPVMVYAVFFIAEKDNKRSKRVLLRVQSAYLLEVQTRRQQKAEKISFRKLLKRAYLKK